MIASASVGVDVSLTDLYPDKYPSADPPGGAKFFYAEALEQPRLWRRRAGARSLITAEEKYAGYRA